MKLAHFYGRPTDEELSMHHEWLDPS
jgi:hypothetical protein